VKGIANRIKEKLFNPASIFKSIALRFLESYPSHILSDKLFLELRYYILLGEKMNLRNPKNINEKLQWLKLYNRNPGYTKMADKYGVRSYIANTIGEKYLIPLLGVWDNFDMIDFDSLPSQFVIKCTHDSGSVVICHNKSEFDRQSAKREIEWHLKRNYFYHGREWQYKDIKPKIIIEQLMRDDSGISLKDYKVFCFNGEPKLIEVDINRFANYTRNYYSPDWKYQFLEDGDGCPSDYGFELEKPEILDLMLLFSRKLSFNIPYLRIDWYINKTAIYFVELTFFDGNGLVSYKPSEWRETMGEWLTLPKFDK
jgi:hypothetical protein